MSRKIILLLVLMMGCTFIQAQNFSEIVKAVASDGAYDDQFGFSVAISGNYAVIGSRKEDEDENGNNTLSEAGAAYIFRKDEGGVDNWGQIKKIVASDRAIDDNFGWKVAISGEYVVVGTFHEEEDENGNNTLLEAGAAYIFKKDAGGTDNWGQIKKIVASDRKERAHFGFSVGISGNYVVIGARNEEGNAAGGNFLIGAGAAYIFEKDEGGTENWGQVQKIVAQDRSSSDQFGFDVYISGTYIITGALTGDSGASTLYTGAAYIFKKSSGVGNNWVQVKKVVASDRASWDFFGCSVAISGDYVVVGAFNEGEDENGNNTLPEAGAAYIFKKDEGGVDNWGQIKKIVASDRSSYDRFGQAVAILGNNIIIGALYESEDENGNNSLFSAGSAYIFKKNEGGVDNWGQAQKIVASDRSQSSTFGRSVAMSGDYVLSGARSASNGYGSAYFFKIQPIQNIDQTYTFVPVELLSFQAIPKNRDVLLNWQTATELNNDYFEVEWSVDGEEFEVIGRVDGMGTTLEEQFYDFTHNSPFEGQNYYRLRQVDFDGAFEYSDIINIQINGDEKEITIFPNPVKDKLTIQATENINRITIYNSLGQLMKQVVIENNNDSFEMNLSELQEGVYSIQLQGTNGKMRTKQLIKYN